MFDLMSGYAIVSRRHYYSMYICTYVSHSVMLRNVAGFSLEFYLPRGLDSRARAAICTVSIINTWSGHTYACGVCEV